jgi:sarcosine oxidase delta subunit
VDESAFYSESQAKKPAVLNCPYCRSQETYELNWIVRTKRAQLPPRADERDRAKFAKAQSYMVLLDNQANCKNLRCRRRFDISGLKTMAFL